MSTPYEFIEIRITRCGDESKNNTTVADRLNVSLYDRFVNKGLALELSVRELRRKLTEMNKREEPKE